MMEGKCCLVLLLIALAAMSLPTIVLAQNEPPSDPNAPWTPPPPNWWSPCPSGIPICCPSCPPNSPPTISAYMTDDQHNRKDTFSGNESMYLVLVTPFTKYVVLWWEYYPPGSLPTGHWIIGPTWSGEFSGRMTFGPLLPERTEPVGEHVERLKVFDLASGRFGEALVRWTYEAPTSTSSGYLSVDFDKSTYRQGDTVHISGNAISGGCTWTYSPNVGIPVHLTVYAPDGILLMSIRTDPNAAGYKSYAYGYILPSSALPGTYEVQVSASAPCGSGTITGQGTFIVGLSSASTSQGSIWTDKQIYNVGDPITVYWSQSLIFTYLQFDGPYSFQRNVSASARSYFVGIAQPSDVGSWRVSAFLAGGLISCFDITCTYVPASPTLEGSTSYLVASGTSSSLSSTSIPLNTELTVAIAVAVVAIVGTFVVLLKLKKVGKSE